jgi:putative membrane protein
VTAHDHIASADGVLVAFLVVAALGTYLRGVRRAHQRGRPWPWWRTALWVAGLAAATVAVAGPLADAAHSDFRAHVLGHVLLGMLAPLLLVLAAPATLALRGLPLRPRPDGCLPSCVGPSSPA